MPAVATRREAVALSIRLDAKQAERHEAAVKTITGNPPVIGPDDTLNVTYSLFISYFGQVAEKLAAFESILADPSAIRSIAVDELNHGRCLINDVLTSVDRIRASVEG